MELCKAIILVGALLLVPTFQKRIIKLDRANNAIAGETAEIAEHQDFRAVENVMEQFQRQGEIAESPPQEEEHEEQSGKVEEGPVDGGTAASGEAVAKESAAKSRKAKAAGQKKKGKEQKDKGKGEGRGNDKSRDKKDGPRKGKEEDAGKSGGKMVTQNAGKNSGKMVTQKAGQSSGKIVSSGTITRFSYLRGEFHGFIYGENPRSKALLIKCWKAQEEFGREAVLLFRSNSVGAKVGDKISFDVEELRRKVNGVPEPLAVNVRIRSAVPVFIKPKVPFTDTSGFLTVTPLSFTHAQFTGFIYQKISTTRTLLIACSRAHDEFGAEAVIPLWANAVRAEVGDKISFDVEDLVQEGEGKPRPMAINVLIRSRGYTEEEPEVPAPTDVCTQILYYFSDRNLRTDKFFQDTIAASEGGWISTDILLRFPRVKQLAASAQSVVECLQDAPGVEVRDTPGQEAVRRTSPPPPLEGTVAAVLAKSTLVIPAVAKHKYSMEDMMRWGDGPQDRELELSEPEVQELEGPQAHEAQHRDRARRGAITQKHEREARKDNKGNKRPAQPTANIYSAALEAIAEKPVSKRKPPRKGKKASKESKDATGDNVGEEGLAATGTARGPKEAQNQKPVTGKAAEVRKRPQRRQTSSSTAVKKEQATTATETPMATKEAQNQKPATEKAAELPKKKVARRPKRQQGSQGGKAEKEEATTAAETAPRKKKSSNRSAGNAKEKQRKSQEKKEGDN